METCIGIIQVYSVWSLKVSASQTLWYKILLFEFPLLKLYRSVRRNLKLLNKFNIDVTSLLMSSVRAIIICQTFCGNHVISSCIQALFGHQFSTIFNYFVWLRITDEGSVPEIRIWSILWIKSNLKWCMHLSRSLFLNFTYYVSVTAGGPRSPRRHM